MIIFENTFYFDVNSTLDSSSHIFYLLFLIRKNFLKKEISMKKINSFSYNFDSKIQNRFLRKFKYVFKIIKGVIYVIIYCPFTGYHITLEN